MRILGLMLCVFILAACEGAQGDDALPTLITLPTEAPTDTQSDVPVATADNSQLAALESTQTALAATVAAADLTAQALNAPESASLTPTSTEIAATPAPLTTEGPTSSVPSLTPSMTITNTPTRTPTHTPVSTGEQLSPLFQLALMALSSTPAPPGVYIYPTATPMMPPTPVGPPTSGVLCMPPMGGFASVYAADPALAAQIGCSIGATITHPAAIQTFERGLMLYVGSTPSVIYVLYNNGTYTRMSDTWVDGIDPISGGEIAPSGLYEPIRGFGKVWRTDINVRNGLGWATQPESGTNVTLLQFQNGQMVTVPTLGQVAVLTNMSTYRLLPGSA